MMQVKETFHTIFLVILVLHLMTAGNAAATMIYVNNSSGQVADFTSIQAAVDAANPGDEIVVKPGIYEENIAINKNISIVSESGNFSDTIVRAADSSQDVISIWENGVRVKGFGIDGSELAGIHVFGTINCHIENNKLSNNGCGIDLYIMSSGNILDNNVVSDCLAGISLGDSWFNNISNNSVSNCGSGILLFDSPNNVVENCTVSENMEGVSLTGESNGNTLTNNSIILNEKFGLHIYETSNNLIYNNRFNNTVNIESEMVSDTNIWNTTKIEGSSIAGGPYLGGNLWTKPDGTIYPEGVRDLDLDGIFDSQYNIEGTPFIDYLPLKESKPVTFTVNNSTGQVADFTSIQAAIDNALPGDTILIFPGVYEENVDLYVTNLTLSSESTSDEDTIVKATSSLDDIFYIVADGVTIRGLSIVGPVDYPYAGIHLNGVKYCNIENNQLFSSYGDSIPDISSGNSSLTHYSVPNLTSNQIIPVIPIGNNSLTPYGSNSSAGLGIRLDSSSSNVLGNNVLSGHTISVLLRNSTGNTLINNLVSDSRYGIWVDSSVNNMLNENDLSNNEIGAYLKISSGNILSNTTASNNTVSGINLWDSVGNTLNNSTASKNNVSIVLHGSSANLLNNNKVSDNDYGVWLYSSSNDNKLNGNTASNNRVGIYVKESNGNNLADNVALSNTGPGISVWNSTENKLINNTALNNDVSIFLQNSSKNTLLNNTMSSSSYGMWIASSTENNLSENNASNNRFGLYLKNSSSNILSGNWVNSNSRYGIYMGSSWSNVLNDNRIISNLECGLYLMDSGESLIYNNYFSNTNNIFLKDLTAGTSLNTTRTQGKNILGGPYIGGNFWARPEGEGFSQTHPDNDGDGICDVAYVVNKESVDYLPLAGSLTTN